MNVLIFLLSLLVTGTTIADKPKANPISNKISILLSEKTNFSKKNNRKLIASLLLKQLTQLDSLIPYNTPAERSWLEKEKVQSNKRSKRYLHMLDSAIFAKWWLKDRISVTSDWLKENQSDNITEKQEALNWIAIIYTLTPELDMFNQSLGRRRQFNFL
ncbi:hypothetical protein [uncultured Legionella sp.]|uniref:hypothetical protein n=1 Tax=uncultured Legionella sp. TaxID=210934 RepID=UPI002613170E|nr:hypothetical protein [uncultured Legionella sp.]